jgi:hypothetical protein
MSRLGSFEVVRKLAHFDSPGTSCERRAGARHEQLPDGIRSFIGVPSIICALKRLRLSQFLACWFSDWYARCLMALFSTGTTG